MAACEGVMSLSGQGSGQSFEREDGRPIPGLTEGCLVALPRPLTRVTIVI
jgi:hypothetical protein